jgi:type IV secretion system protein VirB5
MFAITLLSLAMSLTLVVAYVRLAHASRFVPFLYVVDRSGEVLALGTPHPIANDADAVIYHALEEFTTAVRAVFRDPNAERYALKRAYAYLPGDNPNSTSTGFLEAYMSNHDPRLLAERFSRTAEIVSILKVPQRTADRSGGGPSSTWRIRWRETTYPVGTAQGDTSEWEAFATVRVHPKKTIEAFDPNPFGIFLDHLSWSRLTPEARP